MKNVKILFLGLVSVAMLMATSCKKETVEPTPPANTQPTVQDTTISLEIAMVEYTDNPGYLNSPTARLVSEAGDTSAVINLTVNAATTTSAYPNACSFPSLTYSTVSKSMAPTSFYRVLIYDGSTLLRKLKITTTNIVDEGGGSFLNICNYSPHKVAVSL